MIFSRSAASVDDHDDDDDDERVLQRPAFPVDDGAAGDETVPPGDGLEYLRRVRRQEQALPAVVRKEQSAASARHSDAKSSTVPLQPVRGSMLAALEAAAASTAPPAPAAVRPRLAWQQGLLAEFAALREQLQRALTRTAPSTESPVQMPDVADASGWEHWCSAGARMAGIGQRVPSVHLLRQLGQPRAVGLLRGVHAALERHARTGRTDCADVGADGDGGEEEEEAGCDTNGDDGGAHAGGSSASTRTGTSLPNEALLQWAFGALACVDRHQLDAEACATVRGIFRSCVELRAEMAGEGMGALTSDEATSNRRAAALNVLITITGGHFAQAPREEWQGD